MVPGPGIGVDGLSHGAEDPKALARVFCDVLVTRTHDGPESGRSGIEDVDPEVIDHLPVATGVGVSGQRLEHHCSGAVGQGAVNNVAVSCDPADIGGAEVDITRVVIKDKLVGHRRIDHVAASGVEHAFWLSSRARCVEDEERVLCSHPLVGAGGTLPATLIVKPEVSAWFHLDLGVGAACDEHGFHHCEAFDRSIDGLLEAQAAAAASSLVGGHHQLGACIDNAVTDGLRAESSEDDRVDGADPRAGEHRVGKLRNHGHVNAHPVASADAVITEDVGDPAHLVLELTVGDVLIFARFVFDPDDGVLIAPFMEVSVDAVVAGVEATTEVPAEVHIFIVVVEDGFPGVEPGEPLCLLRPETLGFIEGQAVEAFVLLHRPDVGSLGDIGFWRYDFDRIVRHCCTSHRSCCVQTL